MKTICDKTGGAGKALVLFEDRHGGLNVLAAEAVLREIGQALLEGGDCEVPAMEVGWLKETERPMEGEALLESIKIRKTTAPNVVIKRVGDSIWIEGGAECMATLSSNLDFLADQPKKGPIPHLHIEHPSDANLDEGSQPLVVERLSR